MTEEIKNDQTANTPESASASAAVLEAAPLKGLIGTKVGMTQVFVDDTKNAPVTVISSAGAIVTQIKTADKDGYNAVQVAIEDVLERKLSKAEVGHFTKKGLKPKRWLHEFRVKDATPFKIGQPVPVSVFAKGEWVQVSGLSKGKGYAGVVKRHGFSGGPHSHGHHEYRNSAGSSGAQGPQRVFKGSRRAGHMGHVWSSVPKIEIVDVDAERNLILLRGSVPGPNGNFVVLNPTKRKVRVGQPAQTKKKGKK
jgi:large subunit ribosomal protein L3